VVSSHGEKLINSLIIQDKIFSSFSAKMPIVIGVKNSKKVASNGNFGGLVDFLR